MKRIRASLRRFRLRWLHWRRRSCVRACRCGEPIIRNGSDVWEIAPGGHPHECWYITEWERA